MGVSKNRGTPKWMVYNGKPYFNGMIWGENPLFSETPIYRDLFTGAGVQTPIGSLWHGHQPNRRVFYILITGISVIKGGMTIPNLLS